ncbi:MAG: SAM-dependent methyltransferase [Crocinitomicaceae bacterium]|jgi:16S rRNA (cytidine1402-2'-O)-methyltransferase|nr:SAM-dependent methyltransferase [Crocinitomicaceae bacterium]MDG1734607.1 SAM-dependent methyltransferase [Crocinitomicaceae bacterium]
MNKSGTLYILPNTLGGESISDIIPNEVIEKAISLRYFIVENIKSARRVLRKMDREFPIDDSMFIEMNKRSTEQDSMKCLQWLIAGNDVGMLSDAGCACVADPGAEIVSLAHSQKIAVIPFVGPSSILLSLMGSGFSGQKFSFHGYLPKDRKERIRTLKTFEFESRKRGYTQIFMDTPYRNMNVLEDLLNELADHTQLCIASNITLHNQRVRTMSVEDWRENAYDLSKSPCVFLIG